MKDTTEITRDVLRRRDDWQRERTARRRGLTRTLAVVLVVLTLCGGAAAAGSNALADFFTGFRRGDLSPEQAAVAGLADAFEPRTAVSGDWTVTVDEAISDGLNFYMNLTVTGPEGWAADGTVCDWETARLERPDETLKHWGRSTWYQQEVRDPATCCFTMCFRRETPTEEPLTLTLGDMVLLGPREDTPVEGSWIFEDLEFTVAGEFVELLEAPVTVSLWNEWEEADRETQLNSVQLRTFSLQVEYAPLGQEGFPELEGQLVLKDGTTYELSFSGGGDGSTHTMNALFGFPVLPDEVDHILLAGMRLDIP